MATKDYGKERYSDDDLQEFKEIILGNLSAYLVSDFSSYINGEVITIDGGEWLKGAGEFNLLEDIPQEMWDQLEAMIRATKKK